MEDAEKEGTQVQRRMTIVAEIGMEGKYVQPGQFEGKSIAVFTSGGDAQGMNSAVRAVVRMGIYCGCKVYFIKEGYQGMVDGGECIVEATWAEVSGIMQLGGTVIGSARCSQFREREGRLKAAKNLLLKDITNLVVIGGDGSLTGANLFREEWTDLLWELADRGDITSTVRDTHNQLNIVGLVGSIDNDFCGTDMTIGTDSALHRIIEATDAIVTTAQSHQRCFVLEVMGRHCGYLALVGALASEADYLFMPEHPPEAGWEDKLCSKLNKNRSLGQRVNILIVAEGAIDRNGEPITSEQIRKLITDKLNIDTRITVLGHVQRGGSPSAFDRILGIRMGAEAVLALMDADKKKDTPACVISIDGNQTVRVPLMGCVRKTRDVSQAMANKDFEKAAALRGRSFNNNLKVYLMLSKICAPETADTESHVIGVVSVGAPAGGMNACMRSFVRLGITRNYRIKSIPEGFRGIQGEIKDFHWNDVRGWAGLGGCAIGVRRVIPSQVGLDLVAEKFRELKLRGLLIIGGFEAYISLLELYEARDKYPEFRIPMIVVPATISNNVPGTEFTLGCDTSINEITQIIDKIKQSANGSMRRVFVVETMGAYCGYLATMSGLAGGADAAYIFEEPFNVTDLKKDAEHMRQKILDHVTRGLILCADYANSNYNTDFIHRLFKEESRNVFDCRMNVLGHSQQGGFPSPFDRNMGTKLGAKAIEWLDNAIRQHTNDLGAAVETTADDTAVLLGMVKAASVFTPVINLKSETDFKHRMPNKQWWMKLRSLMRIMAKHDALYEPEMARIVSKYNKT